jgi:hypothetical protein
MGHQHHFLSRLDRVSLPHVELALTLYRDAGLVQYLLRSAKLPEGAQRVAISLDDPERGPFLIVTRDGRFVTCLGEGMTPGDLPVLPRGQLDALVAKVADLRNRIEAARALAGPKGHTGKLIERIYTAGPWLSREEFFGISAFQPLFGFEFFRSFFGAVTDLEDLRKPILQMKTDRPRAAFDPVLRRYWNTFWSIGHLAVLAFMDGRAIVDSLPPELDLSGSCLSWGAVRQGIVALALRGVWGVAKVGKAEMRPCKMAFDDARSPLQLVTSMTSLTALGVRHAKFRAEVRKALSAPKELAGTLFPPALLEALRACADVAFDKPDQAAAFHRAVGADMAMDLTRHLPPGDPLRFERPEDVPEDLAMSLPVNHRGAFLDDPEGLVLLMMLLPWTARAEPEQFFLPQSFLRTIQTHWVKENTLHLLSPLRHHYKRRVQAPVRSGPARKGPCPCGSGEKYKRCCGKAQADA